MLVSHLFFFSSYLCSAFSSANEDARKETAALENHPAAGGPRTAGSGSSQSDDARRCATPVEPRKKGKERNIHSASLHDNERQRYAK